MSIHKGHRLRLKSRFLKQGLRDFEDHNILELLLFFSKPQGDTNPLGHELLDTFGSLANVFDAPYEELCKCKGVGEHTATLIKMIPDLLSVYHTDRTKNVDILKNTEIVGEYLMPRFLGLKNEEVHVIALDGKKKVIKCEKLFEGTVNASAISIKKIVEVAVRTNATGIILAHNHPGGIAIPSSQDIMVTHKIQRALDLMNIQLCDHIVAVDDDYVSFAASGFLK